MGTVGQGHKWEKRPVIVGGRIDAILSAKPALYLWSSSKSLVCCCNCSAWTIYLAWWKPITQTRGGNSGKTVISSYPDCKRVTAAGVHFLPLSNRWTFRIWVKRCDRKVPFLGLEWIRLTIPRPRQVRSGGPTAIVGGHIHAMTKVTWKPLLPLGEHHSQFVRIHMYFHA